MSEKLSKLLNSIEKDNVSSIIMLQKTDPKLFEFASKTWKDNPLQVACKHGSCNVAVQIAKQNLDFAREKNQEGYTALHLASENGYLPIVRGLVKLDSKLCLEKDKSSMTMIPLHRAIVNGHGDVIRELIAACPESVGKVTSQKETVFHLAVKSDKSGAFAVLLEEIKKPHRLERLLHRKDRQGNNVVHIATKKKQIEILKLLLPRRPTSGASVVRVNSLNKKKLTALDLCHKHHDWDRTTQEIHYLLCEAGAVAGHSVPQRARLIRRTLETKNVILMVLAIVTGAAFTTVFNLPDSFHKHKHAEGAIFHVGDIVSRNLPAILYLMVCNTGIMIVCMCAIIVLLWSLPCRQVVLFVTITMVIVYAMVMDGNMPKFVVRVGTDHHISSSLLVWLLVVPFIGFGALTYHMVRFAMLYLQGFYKWLVS